ncbi:MAG: hypothetical protein IT372_04750 [Polyangiaceae bacterium]|nr:hypothetical protein [Polyangiaceae bacterium]
MEWLICEGDSDLQVLSSVLTNVLAAEIYRANRLFHGTADFLDLANGVRALAGLPSLS